MLQSRPWTTYNCFDLPVVYFTDSTCWWISFQVSFGHASPEKDGSAVKEKGHVNQPTPQVLVYWCPFLPYQGNTQQNPVHATLLPCSSLPCLVFIPLSFQYSSSLSVYFPRGLPLDPDLSISLLYILLARWSSPNLSMWPSHQKVLYSASPVVSVRRRTPTTNTLFHFFTCQTSFHHMLVSNKEMSYQYLLWKVYLWPLCARNLTNFGELSQTSVNVHKQRRLMLMYTIFDDVLPTSATNNNSPTW